MSNAANLFSRSTAEVASEGLHAVGQTGAEVRPQGRPAEPPLNYLNDGLGVASWLLTVDHKRIAIMYLVGLTAMFFIGGAFAVSMRLELATAGADLMDAETYNKLFTLHGVIMIWYFLVPSVPAVFGNFFIPMMIGAKDVAFPRLNLLSLYVFVVGAAFLLYVMIAGGVDTGWTFYTPYSTAASNSHVVGTTLGIFILGFSSILTGINFIVTVHTMRCPGMYWMRLPLFVWSNYATALVIVLATPVLAIVLLLVALERLAGIGVFDPALGGDPVLFQHLFWFYSHPAVYIMILPSFGVISELVATFSRRRVFGYTYVAFASLAIAFIGFLVWGHHMFPNGQSVYAGMVFSLMTALVAVPSAIKVFNWTFTLWKGWIAFDSPLLYALAFIGLYTLGGLTGLLLGAIGANVHVHGTYFVVAHFHFIMVGGAITGFLGGLHYWWPKMTGRLYPEGWAKLGVLLIFAGFVLTFMPQYVMGYLGMPRRYHTYPAEYEFWHVLSSAGASILGVGFLIPMVYFAWSMRYGPKAGPNPWGATGLEWQTPSPPPTENFARTPVVTTPAYYYPGREVEID